MIDSISTFLFGWVINYFIHSTLFILAVLIAVKYKAVKFDCLGEWLMKSALVLGAITALIQTSGALSHINNTDQLWTYELQHSNSVSINSTKDQVAGDGSTELLSPFSPEEIRPNNIRQANDEPTAVTQPFSKAKPTLISSQPLEPTGLMSLWLMIWLAGTGLILSKYLYQSKQLIALLDGRKTVSNQKIITDFDQLLSTASIDKNIKLSHCDLLNSPIALSNEVVLPTAFLEQHKHAHIKAAMAHELAHIKRRDCQWLKFTQVFPDIDILSTLESFHQPTHPPNCRAKNRYSGCKMDPKPKSFSRHFNRHSGVK